MAEMLQEFILGLTFGKADEKGLTDAEKKARESAKRVREEWSKAGKDIGKSLAIAGGAALGAGIGLFKLAENSARAADELDDAAKAMGVSVRELQRLRHGLQIAGGNVDGFDKAIKRWTGGLSDAAAKGIGPVVDRLNQLGLSAGELIGLGLEDQIGIISDRFQGLASEQERAAIAADLFGAKADIKQLLDRSSTGIRELGDEAERLGLVLSQDTLDATGDFTDSIDRMKAQIGAIARDVGISMIPTIQGLIEKVRAWVTENRELIKTRAEEFVRNVSSALQQLLPAVQQILPVMAKAVELTAGLANAAGPAGATTAIVAMRGALSGSLGPIGAVTAALAILVSTVVTAAEETQDLQFALEELKHGKSSRLAPEGTRTRSLQESRQALVRNLEIVEEAGKKRRGSGSTGGFQADQRDRAAIVKQIQQVDAAIAAEQRKAGEKARFDADVQRESEQLEQRTQARIDAKRAADAAKKKGKGGKAAAFDAEFDEFDFEFDDIEGEGIRRLADQAGVGDVAYTAAIKAGGSALRSGATKDVARQAARSALSGLTGQDYSASKDPILSEIFGENVPDANLSMLAMGATPNTLIATINNNFDVDVENHINGAGNPAEVGAQVTATVRAVLTDEVAKVTKLYKPPFRR